MACTKIIHAAFLLLMATTVLCVNGVVDQEKVVSLGGVGFSKTHKVEWKKPNPEEGMDVDYYRQWASSRNFTAGDTIVFEYNNQTDNVKQVLRRDFESCNRRTRPLEAFNTGSDSIHLKFRNHYYFLSDLPGHCEAGQKLEIVVTDASLPRTPTYLPHPHVDPNIINIAYPVYKQRVSEELNCFKYSTAPPELYCRGVGFSTHKIEWKKPNPKEGMDVDYYRKWASSRNFTAGDIIVFEYNNQTDNLKQVLRRDFESCNRRTRPLQAFNTGSDSIHLIFRNHYYFLSDFPGHCEAGQKLEIVVTDGSLPRTPTYLPHIGFPVYKERVLNG